MNVDFLEVVDYRGIPKLRLDFEERITVLVGENGSGKSAILDCMAIMLSRLIGRIRSSKGTGRIFTDQDISNAKTGTQNTIGVSFRGNPVQWCVSKTRRGRKKQTITNLSGLRELVKSIHSGLERDEDIGLPLTVYYPVNRAVLDIPLRIRKKHPFDKLSAYDQALSGERSDFRIFFEWFREREDLENEKRLGNPKYRDRQLQTVRKATERFLPGFKKLRVKRLPLRMVVEMGNKELIVNQLSDGEKCSLAMVGDLARRMAIANPSMRNPLEGDGVVLIDEIDLHLHPGWQREVVSSLEATFPNCQFILSTHSPQILGHLKPQSIWILERTKSGVTAKRPESAYGLESSRVLEDIMKVPARPKEIKDKLSNLFLSIERGRMEEAKLLTGEIRQEIGEDPDLVKADVLIRRKEVLGK